MKLVCLLGLASALVAAGFTRTPATGAAADPRSGFVIVANQQSASASLINLKDDAATVIPVGNGPHEAVISASGRTAVVTIYGLGGAPGNELAVIDVAAGVVMKRIALGQYTRPHGAMFLGGDTRVAVTSETTQNLVVVNLDDGKVEYAIPTGAAASHMVAITADGKRAFTANIDGGSVSELDIASKSLVRTIAVAPRVEGIAVTPDGGAVWAGSNTNGTVSIVETKTGTIAATLTGFKLPYRLAISSDGRTAIICDPEGDRIHVADVAARNVTWTLDALGSPRGVNIAPDGRTAFVTLAADETMGVVDLETRRLTRKIKVERSPDGVWFGPAR
jgi:YVTN family beta-propeller protein